MRALSIAFHHADFYLLNKPAGAPMHANDVELSVVHQLAAQTGETLYPVHRLDTPTSGALLIAAVLAEMTTALRKASILPPISITQC